ncbi:bifunctional protein FolD protein [bacterium BMS3Abin15]|nr:bifunctional protein FolD protein [bacterium BMS3Abin15]HDZ85028.1 bifunctional 5,10-methylenetetrahydrofolate dehydrogenase/5,10-methenyltetrahydrofolate cyclohydrolase [Candidatus Moranbacteria bacterium]
MELLEGKKIAEKMLEDIKDKIKSENLNPGLAVILVGNNDASKIYIDIKDEAAAKVGIDFQKIEMSEDVSEGEVLEKISELNKEKEINGIIVQLPLPKHLDKLKIIKAIDPQKDADRFHPENLELFLKGDDDMQPPFPRAIMELINYSGENLESKEGIIICNSDKFGKVMQFILEKHGTSSEYILKEDIQSNSENIKNADILISACGVPGLIRGDTVKQGVIIVDGGITRADGKIIGDINPDSVKDIDGYISPVPGGVGPVTVACLMENVYLLTKNQ